MMLRQIFYLTLKLAHRHQTENVLVTPFDNIHNNSQIHILTQLDHVLVRHRFARTASFQTTFGYEQINTALHPSHKSSLCGIQSRLFIQVSHP
jgi:hypothetical protein